jgi:hypothetical protein
MRSRILKMGQAREHLEVLGYRPCIVCQRGLSSVQARVIAPGVLTKFTNEEPIRAVLSTSCVFGRATLPWRTQVRLLGVLLS